MNEQARYSKQWKILLIVLALTALTLDVWSSFYWKRGALPEAAGTLAANFGTLGNDYRRPILKMEPVSPLQDAGAKVGDTVRFDSPADLLRVLGTDEKIGITIFSGGQAKHVLLTPVANPDVGTRPTLALARSILLFLYNGTALVVAVLIGLRRADSISMRMFSLAVLAICFDVVLFRLPAGVFNDIPIMLFQPSAVTAEYVGLTFFALTFPNQSSHWRLRWVRCAFWVYAGIFLTVVGAFIASGYMLLPPSLLQRLNIFAVARNLTIFAAAACISALFLSWKSSSGPARQRLAWMCLSMGTIYSGYLFNNLNGALGRPVSAYLVDFIQNALGLVSLLGLTYAALRHRVFDFSFAINRVLVFTILSAGLLLVFGLTEWGVHKLLHFEGREKNVIFDAMVALGIFLSFHRIQHWVNHKVDHIFFHNWYEAAEKMRRFIEKAPHISSASALHEKFIAEVNKLTGASGSAIYGKRLGQGYCVEITTFPEAPATIGMDNDAVIAVAHSRNVVHLLDCSHALEGELLFPLMVRGEVSGLLIVGAKKNGQNFRPDEIALLSTAVHHVALDLEGLRVTELGLRVAELEQKVLEAAQSLTAVRLELSTANETAAMLERITIAFGQKFAA
jgi:hypothetical protein